MKPSASTAASLLLCSVGLVTWLRAGPLTPPAGPVASSYKTLTEVEPRIAINAANTPGDADSLYKITQPGSYYLTGNITGAVDKHGIEVAASGVTIDLNGFDLARVPGPGVFGGIKSSVAGLVDIAVKNGTVRNWDAGIDLGSIITTGCRVENIRASGNLLDGIWVGVQSVVSGCAVSGGADGIYSYNESVISNCSATGTSVVGLRVADGGTMTGCSAVANAGVGFSGTDGCTLTACSAVNNSGGGFSLGDGCTISQCSAASNAGSGILAGSNSLISSCSVSANTADGILVGGTSLVVGNQCRGTTAANSTAMRVAGNFCRIEGNALSGAAVGLKVDGVSNLMVRNTATLCTVRWDIHTSNFGQYVTTSISAAVSGSSGGTPLGTTDPWVNVSY